MDEHRPTTDRQQTHRVSWPSVSVIVPVYNDPGGLRETLEAVTDQSYPDDSHEILVVDNDSTDETPTVAKSFADRYAHVEYLLEDDRQSSYAARNTGIRHASGDVFAFVDADMTVDDDWLESAICAFEEKGAEYMACNVEVTPSAGGESLVEKYTLRTAFPIGWFIDELEFAPTCCLVVDRSVIEDVGSFDPRLISSGDREFGHRVRDSGRELQFAPEVSMYHPARASLESVLKKSRRIGRGFCQLRALYPSRYSSWYPCALNPGPFLPPRLSAVREIDGWERLTRRERVGFYLLRYGKSVTKGLGKIEETVRRTDDDGEIAIQHEHVSSR